MIKKSKIIVLVAAALCGIIFLVFLSLGVAELCSYNPTGKTYRASYTRADDEEKKVNVFHKITFYGKNYEYECYEITFFKEGGKSVDTVTECSGGYEVDGNGVTLSDFSGGDSGFEISRRDLVWGELTLTRSGYWRLGVYWGVGAIVLLAGAGALGGYKFYLCKKARKAEPENAAEPEPESEPENEKQA